MTPAILGDPDIVSQQGMRYQQIEDELRNELHLFERLENSECIAAYGSTFVSDRTTVVLLVSTSGTSSGIANWTLLKGGSTASDPNPYRWICNTLQEVTFCNVDNVIADAENWQIRVGTYDYVKVDYCLRDQLLSIASSNSACTSCLR